MNINFIFLLKKICVYVNFIVPLRRFLCRVYIHAAHVGEGSRVN